MTENLKKYLEEIIFEVKGSQKYKKEIKSELSDHIADLYSEYLNENFEPEQAEKMVLNVMGTPHELAKYFNMIVVKKATKNLKKYGFRGMLSLSAAFVLFVSVNTAITYKNDYDKYKNFLKGIDDGRVSVVDTMTDSLYSSNYKKNALLTRAIESYDEVSKKNGFKKMLVAKNAIGILEDAKWKKTLKVFTFLLALMSLTIMICAVSFAAEKEKQTFVTKAGYTITIEEAETDEPSLYADPDQTVVKPYNLTITDRNGVKIGVYTAKFTGLYSRVDRTSQMLDVTVSKKSGSATYVSWQTHTDAEDGFATFYVLGEYFGTLTGHISYTGSFTFDFSE